MRMRKKSLAITLFSVGFCAMVIVATIAIMQNKSIGPWYNAPVDNPKQVTIGDNLYPAYIEEGKWGYIDASGAWAIKPIYEDATDFVGEVAWVELNGKWGAIDNSGKVVVDIDCNQPRDVGDGYMIVVKDNRNSSLYNPDGSKIFGVEGGISYISDGLLSFSRIKDNQRLYGYIDLKGKIVVAPIYAKAGAASAGWVIVEDENGSRYLLNVNDQTTVAIDSSVLLNSLGDDRILVQDARGIYGYLGTDGKQAIDFKYHYATPFQHQAALVKTTLGYGLIDVAGNELVSGKGYGTYLDNGIYGFAKKEGAPLSLFDSKGNLLVAKVVDINGWSNNYLSISTVVNSCFIQKDGKLLTAPKWQGSYNWQYVGDIIRVSDSQGLAYYNLDQSLIYTAGWYESISGSLVIKRETFNPDGYLRIAYPEIFNNDEKVKLPEEFADINKQLEEMAKESWEDDYRRDSGNVIYGVEGDYKAAIAGHVVSVVQNSLITDYTDGGSQEKRIESLVFDSQSGEIYHLSDLFVNDYDWRDQLLIPATTTYKASCNELGIIPNNQVLLELQERLSRHTPFSLDKDGITIYVAYGENAVYMPIKLLYKDLTVYIDKESTIWSELNK